MFWKSSDFRLRPLSLVALPLGTLGSMGIIFAIAGAICEMAQGVPVPFDTPTPTPHRAPAVSATPSATPLVSTIPTALQTYAKPLKLKDVDNHSFTVNRRGRVCIVFETDEDSQDMARQAGQAVASFEGRHDFQMTVVVDLSDSLANFVPDLAVSKMRQNLDAEALELKPYYTANKNPNNPRKYMHVVPDFDHSVGPLFGWKPMDGELRGVLYGGNGKEIMRWNKIVATDLPSIVTEVKKAMNDLLTARSGELPTSTTNHTPFPNDD